MTTDNMGEALDWDEEVSDEGGFTLLPAGTYPFEVIKVEKEYFEGSMKLSPCPRAKIVMNVLTNDGWVPLTDSLLLNSKVAWRVAKFFEGLGYVKNPETGKVPMRWNEVEGKQGWLKVKVRKFTKKDGSEGEGNDVEAYLKPDEWPDQPTTQQAPVPPAATQPATPQAYQQAAIPMPAQQPAPQAQFHPGYTAGSF